MIVQCSVCNSIACDNPHNCEEGHEDFAKMVSFCKVAPLAEVVKKYSHLPMTDIFLAWKSAQILESHVDD